MRNYFWMKKIFRQSFRVKLMKNYSRFAAVYRVRNCLPKAEEILSKTESASVKDFLETVKTKIIKYSTNNRRMKIYL